MDVVFVSNYMNVHQEPFCEELRHVIGRGGGDFHFIAMTPFDEARSTNGYCDMNEKHSWILKAYESKSSAIEAEELCKRADFAIIAPEYTRFSELRAQSDKLTLLYSERILKRGQLWRFIPLKWARALRRYHYIEKDNFGLLCAGSFVAGDMASFGLSTTKCVKWGYFPSTAKSQECARNRSNDFLWVGRMIAWKQPHRALELMTPFLLQGAQAVFIGDGPLFSRFEKTVLDCGLGGSVKIMKGLPNAKIREEMRNSKVFVTSSTKREGWGAVLNEAMASGCCCVASKHAGSTGFLIEDGANGYVWDPEKASEVQQSVDLLLRDEQRWATMGKRAVETMVEVWSPRTAAGRILSFMQAWSENPTSFPNMYSDGPLSSCRIRK